MTTTRSIRVVFYVLVAFMAIYMALLILWAHKNDTPLPRMQPLNESISKRTFNILIFNPPDWVSVKEKNKYLATSCEWSNCRLTSNRTNLQSYSAIIYFLTAPLPQKPPISPANRNPNQVWIFAWLEPASRHTGIWGIYQNAHWRNTVNWTMTYTHDADVFFPYGEFRKRSTPPVKNYSQIFHRKTKMAAWAVSRCRTHSQRDKYVNKLKQYGVKVDVFGKCGRKNISHVKMRNEIELNYKFYLSFENSFCKDYITEKFFKYIQYDVLLVARGGGNYSSLLPKESYINTADFKSVKELAKHLLDVSSSEMKYSNYLMNKDMFESTSLSTLYKSYCDICQKLNNLEKNRRIYTDLVERVKKGTCSSPSDIK